MGRSFHEAAAVAKVERYEKPFVDKVWLGIRENSLGVAGRSSNG